MAIERFRYPSFLFDMETLTGLEVVYRSGIDVELSFSPKLKE
jgi:hypothetical protein